MPVKDYGFKDCGFWKFTVDFSPLRISKLGQKKQKYAKLEYDYTVDFNTNYTMPSLDKKIILILPEKENDFGESYSLLR